MSRYPAWPEGSADALERELLGRWQAEDLFRQSLARTAAGEPFVFYEGPPTANGRPGLHHVFARTIKDLVCRFRTMQGRQVTRIAGWDTHGLPVEIEVEKEFKLAGKRDIETFGVEEFNRRARESVFRYKDEWERLSDRIGYWLDYSRPYVTCSNEYVESVWWLLKRLFEKGLLVRGHRVLPYCPRCGTVLSSHELALGYDEVKDRSIYVAFPLEDGSGRELVVWTTTPWTLPSNVAVAVHPGLEYGEYRDGDRTLVIATARAQAALGLDRPPQRVLPGAELVGRRYRRPLDIVPLPDAGEAGVVVPGDFVTAEDGSGIVHLAPAFGADDFEAGQRHGLAFLRPVGADGAFAGTTWPELEGRLVTADETNELIIRRLKADGRHLRTEQYVHSYPHCWRCRSKLIYYARDSWFVRTTAVKARMLELNRQTHWHPAEVGTGRFGEWLENNVDWALSRDRYWGTPLPVWVSDADPAVVEVVGSYAELAAKTGRPLPDDFDPHKPYIDRYTWPAPGGGTMRRVPEVIDTWFDSGAMPYAQWHYPFAGEEEFRRHFPADFICEGLDQTRGWFYSLLAIATAAFDAQPYRHVVVNGLVLDAEGQKMSKSRGNVADPWALVAQHGADATRLYLLAQSAVWLPKRFDARQIPESAAALRTLRETYRFLALYAGAGDAAPAELATLDRWVLGRLDALVRDVTAAFEGYDVTEGVRRVLQFIDADLSNWYVRLSRARFWAPDREADPAAVATLRECLETTCRLLAPAAPFASDWIHRALAGASVHLAAWPADAGRLDPSLDRAMEAIRTLASLARAAREDGNLRVRQPLARLQVVVPPEVPAAEFDALLDVLRSEVNVKAVEHVASDAALVRLRAKPNFRALGARYGRQTPQLAAACAGLDAAALRRLEAGEPVTLTVDGTGYEIRPEDVAVQREVLSDWLVQSSGPFVVALDPVVTEPLRKEGLARELVSRVQRARREADYNYAARIRLWVDGDPAVVDAARTHATFIAEETLARELAAGTPPPAGVDMVQETDVDGARVVLGLQQLTTG